jgi:antitoxin component of MazEF toxin-antitoxin module
MIIEAGLAEGDWMSLDFKADRSIQLRSRRRKYSLDELVAGISKKNRHHETDWGRRSLAGTR